VVEGNALPPGTVRWASGKMDSCITTRIIPAVPRPGDRMFSSNRAAKMVTISLLHGRWRPALASQDDRQRSAARFRRIRL
jgi:hypothetical protein